MTGEENKSTEQFNRILQFQENTLCNSMSLHDDLIHFLKQWKIDFNQDSDKVNVSWMLYMNVNIRDINNLLFHIIIFI